MPFSFPSQTPGDTDLRVTWYAEPGFQDSPYTFEDLSRRIIEANPSHCTLEIKVPRTLPIQTWTAFFRALRSLLEHHIQLDFVCEDSRVNEWFCRVGAQLIGTVQPVQ